MRALINNCPVQSRPDPLMTIGSIFRRSTPSRIGLELTGCRPIELMATLPMLHETFRLVQDLICYAYLSGRIAEESEDMRTDELHGLLDDRFVTMSSMIHELGSRLVYDGRIEDDTEDDAE